VSVSESTLETVNLIASVLASVHPLVEIWASKDPNFFCYFAKSQALFLAPEINIQALKIESASLTAHCEAAQVQCEAIRVKPNLIVAWASVLAATAVEASVVPYTASSGTASKVKPTKTAPTASMALTVTMTSMAQMPKRIQKP
jgi:hypothetical protein